MTLTRETFVGPWAGLPAAWTGRDEFDEETYRGDVARCCAAGLPGVYSGGTTGEFYAMEFHEFAAVARATVEECHERGRPAMVGCTSTYTLGACRRAAYAAEIGADAVQAALPFWMEVDDREVVRFFKEVSAACGGLPLSIYDTSRTKKTLRVDQHRAVKEAVPNYLMVKATSGSAGAAPEGCAALSEFVNVFVGETLWPRLGPLGAAGSCSAMAYWNPRLVLAFWDDVRRRDWPRVEETGRRAAALHEFLAAQFGPKGFTDTAYDRLMGRATGFLKTSLRSRGPYPSCTEEDVAAARAWLAAHWPEMLDLRGRLGELPRDMRNHRGIRWDR